MSESEFELYLSLLSRFLRLKPSQREEIAAELRDHLSERLEELTADGLSREEAICRALDEFGDAADLAAHFTQLSRRRKRKLIMRCTAGTIITTSALIFIATSFWPDNRAMDLPQKLAAQKKTFSAESITTSESPQAKVERILESQTQIDISDMPLNEVFEYLSESHKVDIFLDQQHFKDEGILLPEIINFQVKHAPVTLRTALEMILELASAGETTGITIREGFIYLTAKGTDLQIQIYNVRDLLEGVEGKLITGGGFGGGFGGGGGGFYSVGDSEDDDSAQPQIQGGGVVIHRESPGEALISVITSTVQPDSWEVNGGDGSIEEFNGLLVARAAQNVHREIEQLLKMMREAAKENVVR